MEEFNLGVIKPNSIGKEPKDIVRPVYDKDDVVLVIDGDILAYKISTAVEDRYVTITNSKGDTRDFQTKTKFKEWCKSKGKSFDDYSLEEKQSAESIEFCLGTLKRAITKVMNKVGANKVEIYVEGTGNFRKELPLIDLYKDREVTLRPIHLKACKQYLIDWQGAIAVDGRETDDFFQQRLYELHLDGIKAIGYSNDKDSKQEYRYDITLFNPDHNEVKTYKGGVGELWESSNGIKGSGLVWLCFQCILFDKIDSYCMNQFYTKRYGEKSFFKDFKDLKTKNDVLSKAVEKLKLLLPEKIEYIDCFGKKQGHNWLSLTELYFQCCYMKVKDNDNTTFESLLKEYGVEY